MKCCRHGERDGQDDIVGGERDGGDDVVVGEGDCQDEFDVSSRIGSEEDFVSEDDVVDVSVHEDEQPQEQQCQGNVFVEVGT
ncbi:hypothetical protein LR48_Vigan10g121300 [Vigna angularis]|uniref:Uncharacterized protein n=1 Tax=Phaseolus angularis TaxID=3914 RepID=A0A0L9VJU0_PHAAN|nr:hypothetical protein LR48_Vigan10g121300 [Vigna angularis]